MRLDLSDHMTAVRHNGVTRVDLQADGEDVAVLLVPTGVTSATVTGQIRALTADGYRMRKFAPLVDDPHVTAYALARPLRRCA